MRTPAAIAQWPGVHLEGRVSLRAAQKT